MLKAQFDVTTSNQAVDDGRLPKTMQETLDRLKPEAAYFMPMGGKRTALIFFDLADPSQIPPAAEPFFRELGASVEIIPAMNADDLKAGLQQVMGAATG
jgi:hypothetical protein